MSCIDRWRHRRYYEVITSYFLNGTNGSGQIHLFLDRTNGYGANGSGQIHLFLDRTNGSGQIHLFLDRTNGSRQIHLFLDQISSYVAFTGIASESRMIIDHNNNKSKTKRR